MKTKIIIAIAVLVVILIIILPFVGGIYLYNQINQIKKSETSVATVVNNQGQALTQVISFLNQVTASSTKK